MIPGEAQEIINSLKSDYTPNGDLDTFHIFHMYDTGEYGCENEGYADSMFFHLYGYNTDTMESSYIGRHDGIRIISGTQVDIVRIFADGSTLIRTNEECVVSSFQEVSICASRIAGSYYAVQ